MAAGIPRTRAELKVATVERVGGTATVEESEELLVDALQVPQPPAYARPAPGG